jgi:hypothetical protein
MSVDEIRMQKGLALLEQREIREQLAALQKQAGQMAEDLRQLADLVVRAIDQDLLTVPPTYVDLSPEAFALIEQGRALRQELWTATSKLKQLGLS